MRLQINTNIHLNLYRLLPLVLILWPAGNAAADRLIGRYRPQNDWQEADTAYLEEGDEIAGYKVSSTYDLERVHPVRGVIEPHYGIDVATPIGTRLLAPENIDVVCWWDEGGGGEVATVTMQNGEQFKLLHLSSCASGNFDQGATFARTGSSGTGTGPHLDVRRQDKQEPSRQDIEPLLTGEPGKPSISDAELTCSIGAAEGTRDRNCVPNEHYQGHTDPGNGVSNLGTFSYQHGASSPEEADRRQLARLRAAEKSIQAQAQEKFDRPLSKEALAAALDLWNQSPKAGNDFIRHLPSPTPDNEQIIDARSKAYVAPVTGQLDAPGLGDASAVEADQARRTKEVQKSIQQKRLEQLQNQ